MRFGTADLWNTNVGTSRIISKLYKHPLYTPGKAYFDVGVVEAQKILEFTNYVMPICLPMRPIDDEDALEGKDITSMIMCTYHYSYIEPGFFYWNPGENSET